MYYFCCRCKLPPLSLIVAGLLAIATSAVAQVAQPAPSDVAPDTNTGVETLTRGPVHEAFAEVIAYNAEPSVIVSKAPPAAIDELPPDEKPAGDNVTWIPGYWAWDDERNDFLWISGIWRAIPPDRQWISGYWLAAEGGYRWVSGYWADAAVSEVEYLPQPPESLEVGPNVVAPSSNHVWIPGVWTYRQARYVWRPGYWFIAQPNWVWTPDYYVWTPGGFVFVSGFWDYQPLVRGVLFAPVYFAQPLFAPGYFFTPATVINLALFNDHLFCRPRFQHYYFGDYYAAGYLNQGFLPWFAYHQSRGYDPFFAYQRWSHRDNRDWLRDVERNYQLRRDDEGARPPRTWEQVRQIAARDPDVLKKVAVPFDQWAKRPESPVRFQPIDRTTRQQFVQEQQQVKEFRQRRQQLESQAQARPAREPIKLEMPKTPIASQGKRDVVRQQAKGRSGDVNVAGDRAIDLRGVQPGQAPRDAQAVQREFERRRMQKGREPGEIRTQEQVDALRRKLDEQRSPGQDPNRAIRPETNQLPTDVQPRLPKSSLSPPVNVPPPGGRRTLEPSVPGPERQLRVPSAPGQLPPGALNRPGGPSPRGKELRDLPPRIAPNAQAPPQAGQQRFVPKGPDQGSQRAKIPPQRDRKPRDEKEKDEKKDKEDKPDKEG